MQTLRRTTFIAAAVLSATVLSGCVGVAYRCPLDPSDKPDAPTACKNMHEAMDGAKRGTGGATSVFLDDKGRIIPREIMENRAASPIRSDSANNEVYFPNSGTPAFVQPKKFKVWTRAYQDAEGNLHDGHNSWFTTPGRWSRGTLDSNVSTAQNLMVPARATDRPKGRIIATDRNGNPLEKKAPTSVPQTTADQAKREADAAALRSLSQAANSVSKSPVGQQARPAAQSASGVTAPAVLLGN